MAIHLQIYSLIHNKMKASPTSLLQIFSTLGTFLFSLLLTTHVVDFTAHQWARTCSLRNTEIESTVAFFISVKILMIFAYISYFLYSQYCVTWGLNPDRLLVPRLANSQTASNCLFDIQTNQSTAHPPSNLFYQTLTHQANICPPLNHPKTRYQTTRTTTIAMSPPELFKLSNPKLTQSAYPASPTSSHRNPNKGSGPRSLLPLPSLLTHLGASPRGPPWRACHAYFQPKKCKLGPS